jgi:hypothetical protein
MTCRARYHSGYLSPRRTSDKEANVAPHLSCPPPQWLVDRTLTEETEARAAPSSVVPATTVADCAHADRANRGQSSALTCRARHHIASFSSR